MKHISLLLSPRAKSAYFNDYLAVAKAELAWVIGSELFKKVNFQHQKIGEMDFFNLEIEENKLPTLARLSFVYGIFKRIEEQLVPLDIGFNFHLHEDFIYGAKFKGKTNETLTQLLINIGLATQDYKNIKDIKLLDPMCGRATTLLWAVNYGIQAKGIEQEETAIADVRQLVKKWTKIHRQKHQLREGSIGAKADKKHKEKFLDFKVDDATMRVIGGDSQNATRLLKNEKFHLLISDLPYGVQHFTTAKTRNPLAVLQDCVGGWVESLKPDGVIVLSFNNYMPKREELKGVFSGLGLMELEFSATHRMSESIVRDILVLRKN